MEHNTFPALLLLDLGEQEIVILHLPETLHALAFVSEIEGQPIKLSQDANRLIVDESTGSFWSFDGEAYQGELKGQRLTFIDSWIEEWYGWAAYHPESEIYSVN